jgi:hypothetical protein
MSAAPVTVPDRMPSSKTSSPTTVQPQAISVLDSVGLPDFAIGA